MAVLFMTLAVSSSALAQTPPATTPPPVNCADPTVASADCKLGKPVEGEQLKFNVAKALQELFDKLRNIFKIDVSAGVGKTMIVSFLTMGVVVGGIRIMGGMDYFEAVIRWIKMGLLGIVALGCFTPSPLFAALGDGGPVSLGEGLRLLFVNTGTKVMDGADPIGDVAGQFLIVVMKILSVNVVPQNIPTAWGFVEWLVFHGFAAILAMVFVGGSALVMALVGALVVGEVFFAGLTMSLAQSLAPVLVPWVMFAPTSFLFDAWLRTILTAGMTYLVANLVAKGALGFADAVTNMASQMVTSSVYSVASVAAAFGGMFLITLIFMFVAQKISSAAAAMISGGVMKGVGIQEFRAGVGGIKAAGGSMAGAARAGGRAAGGAAGAVAGAAAGALKGTKAGSAMSAAANTAKQVAMKVPGAAAAARAAKGAVAGAKVGAAMGGGTFKRASGK